MPRRARKKRVGTRLPAPSLPCTCAATLGGEMPAIRPGARGAPDMTYFEEIGGESRLAAIIDEFVERVFSDTMIGYLFARANKERVKRMEYEHAAQFLGAGIVYGGRPLRDA